MPAAEGRGLRGVLWARDTGRGRGRDDRDPAERRADERRQRQAGEEWGVGEPRERAHHEPHPAERDVHEGAHEPGVELRSGAACELGAGFGGLAGSLYDRAEVITS